VQHRRRGFATGVLLLTLLLMGALPAGAQQPAADARELGLAVTVGLGGRSSGSAWTPVEVVVEPARLLTGTLTVSTRSISGAASEVVEIEAAARTRRAYRFVVPNGPVTVRIDEAGRNPVEVRPQRTERERGFTVGYLGERLPDGAPPVQVEPAGLDGAWVPVDPEWLGVSPAALDPLGALVAPASAIAELSEDARTALRSAVVIGGTDLVVVGDVAGDLPDLGIPLPARAVIATADGRALDGEPAAWALSAAELDPPTGTGDEILATRSAAGRGSVAVVAAAPGEGELGRSAALWSLLVSPPVHTNLRAGDYAADTAPFQMERLFTTEQSSAPSLPWLALFMFAYVLVVGPVNGVVLGRLGRRELAWATVPIVTVVFTAGAFLGVAGSRPSEGLAGRVLLSLDGVATEVVAAGVRAPTEGTRSIALAGQGWTARTLTAGGRGATLRRDDTGLQAELQLGGLQFGGLVASRSTDERPPLEIEATAGREGALVRVRNTGSRTVDGVVVRVATTSRAVGTLAPGEEREVDVAGTSLTRVSAYRDAFGGLRPDGTAMLEALLRDGVLDGSPGTAWVVGTLPEAAVDGTVGALAPTDRGLLVVAGASVEDDGAVHPSTLRREAISPQRRGLRPSPLALDDLEQALLRFQLPPGAGAAQLRATLGNGERGMARAFAVWLPATRRWVDVAEAFPDGVGDPAQLLDPLGVAWVRIDGDLYPFDHSGAAIDGLQEVGG
jgi:hypothetical protein